jgi:hypothetical protein
MNWKRELEPPMTLERADALLSKARSWHRGKPDLVIARLVHDSSSNALISCFAFSSIFLTTFGGNRNASPWQLLFLLPLFGFLIYFGIQRSRFSRIRQLFEVHSPKNLSDISGGTILVSSHEAPSFD